MESSRRDLSNDRAEHRLILKNNQNTNTPVLVSHPNQIYSIPQNGDLFLLWSGRKIKVSGTGEVLLGKALPELGTLHGTNNRCFFEPTHVGKSARSFPQRSEPRHLIVIFQTRSLYGLKIAVVISRREISLVFGRRGIASHHPQGLGNSPPPYEKATRRSLLPPVPLDISKVEFSTKNLLPPCDRGARNRAP